MGKGGSKTLVSGSGDLAKVWCRPRLGEQDEQDGGDDGAGASRMLPSHALRHLHHKGLRASRDDCVG
jgi:hypothetical protein